MAIVVSITSDGMEAVVDVEIQQGETPNADAILRALATAGVVHGIDLSACQQITGNARGIVVARGSPPIPGQDGKVDLAVELHQSKIGMPAGHGNIDFHERGSYTPIDKGQLIARIVPPTAGTPGKTVDGKNLLAADGKRARIAAGKNTKLEPDGAELRSTINGDLRISGELIEVMDMIRVTGNVDFAVGSIECEGPVRVEGDLLPGFHIRAGGDAWIGGLVEGAEVSSRGTVTVVQGVLGGSRIHAAGRITAGYARDAHLESDGSVTITRECMNTTVVSGDAINMPADGRIVGGRLVARNSIEVGVANFTQGMHTILAISEGPGAHLATCRIRITKEIHPGVAIRFGTSEHIVRSDAGPATFHYDSGSQQVIQT
jgi:uncharacterized protein (DUF342 family)